MMSFAVNLSDVDAVTTEVLRAHQLLAEQEVFLSRAAAENLPETLTLLERLRSGASDCTGKALDRLQRLGGVAAQVDTPAPIPLHLLDTPASRRLLALLIECRKAAEEVDAERGRVVSSSVVSTLPEGQSRGTDLAESISELALRVRTEVHGAKGRE
jgi:hypothetical protein